MNRPDVHPLLRRSQVTSSEIVNVLGVVYVHQKTENDGDIYLTRYGLEHRECLEIQNWYEKNWFEENRERLEGTSAVYRVPTRPVDGKSIRLVVKYSRVGEDVPVNTRVLYEFINAEFNSPWEEFALVFEMREGAFGPRQVAIRTQRPLAIYVPPERMQLWQTGRSRYKINKITHQHPGLSLDILRQYILVYEWIDGLNVVEALGAHGCEGRDLQARLDPLTRQAIADMDTKGYVVADMKPSHIIVGDTHLQRLRDMATSGAAAADRVGALEDTVRQRDYSIIDYELLLRTAPHEAAVKKARRTSYLDDMRDRFRASPLPPHLHAVEILGVPFIHGHAESTGGLLWVVGRNPRLYDYFLPERWRRTPCRALSSHNEILYTLTKDNIHIVWKISRTGEQPSRRDDSVKAARILERGFNSPFEECAIAQALGDGGVPTVYMRAIYMSGSEKIEPVMDPSRYLSHRGFVGADGRPILRKDRNYISLRGYFNGSDAWVAGREGVLCQPLDLRRAADEGVIPREDAARLYETVLGRLRDIGYDGGLLEPNDLLMAVDPTGKIVLDGEGRTETRVCNFELIHPR